MIHIRSCASVQIQLRTRFPFHYGIAVMTELPHVFVQIEAEIDGKMQTGMASDNMSPKWFTKDPQRDPVEEIADMEAVIQHAIFECGELKASSIFAAWEHLYARQARWGEETVIHPCSRTLALPSWSGHSSMRAAGAINSLSIRCCRPMCSASISDAFTLNWLKAAHRTGFWPSGSLL